MSKKSAKCVKTTFVFAIALSMYALTSRSMAQFTGSQAQPMTSGPTVDSEHVPSMQSLEAPQKESNAPSSGVRLGSDPSALQCANLLRRTASVPSLKQSPDYEFCKAHAQ